MKKADAIDRLKRGDTLVYDNEPRHPSANFRSDWATLRIDVALRLRLSGLLEERKSPTAHGILFLTWKAEDTKLVSGK